MNTVEKELHTIVTQNEYKEDELGQPVGLVCFTDNMFLMVCSFCKSVKEFNKLLCLLNHIRICHVSTGDCKIYSTSGIDDKEQLIDEDYEGILAADNRLIKHNSYFDEISSKIIENENSILSSKSTVLDDYEENIKCYKNFDDSLNAVDIKSKQFHCTNCKQNFQLENEILEHKCSYDVSKSEKSFLKRERILDSRIFNYKCEYCYKTYGTAASVWKHIKRYHPNKPNKCKRQLNPSKVLVEQVTRNSKQPQKKQKTNVIQSTEFLCNKSDTDFELEEETRQHVWMKKRCFHCTICGGSFISKGYLDMHMRTHKQLVNHKRVFNYKCEYCYKTYKKEASVWKHIKCCHPDKPNKFNIQLLPSKVLVEHMNSNAEQLDKQKKEKTNEIQSTEFRCDKRGTDFELEEPLQHNRIRKRCSRCTICGVSLKSEEYLEIHMRTHTKEKPESQIIKNVNTLPSANSTVLVDYDQKNLMKLAEENLFIKCDNNFDESLNIVDINSKQFHCNNCKQNFQLENEILEHTCSYDASKPVTSAPKTKLRKSFQCEICFITLKCKRNYVVHQRQHGEGNHKCQYCPDTFYLPTDLKNHLIMHTRIFNYKCEHCYKIYGTAASVWKHIKRFHPGKPNNCNRELNPSKVLEVQMTSNDEQLNQQKNEKTNEIQTNEFQCNKRDTEEEKRQHIWMKKRCFHCTICSGSFTSQGYLEMHMRTHTEEKTCQHCDKNFILMKEFKHHLATAHGSHNTALF